MPSASSCTSCHMEDPSTASQLCATSRACLFLPLFDCSLFAPFAEAAAAPPDGSLELASRALSWADELPIGAAEEVTEVDMIFYSMPWVDIAKLTSSLIHIFMSAPTFAKALISLEYCTILLMANDIRVLMNDECEEGAPAARLRLLPTISYLSLSFYFGGAVPDTHFFASLHVIGGML